MTPRSGTPTRLLLSALVSAVLLAASGCSPSTDEETQPSDTPGSNATASQPGPVTLMGAGDIAGNQDAAAATARLIVAADPDAVFTTGDNAYPDGSTSDYAEKFEPTWGPLKQRTHPVPGNHDYHTAGAAGYVAYFGAENVTNQDDGGLYYAWDVGNGWRAYALNSEISATGAQLEWLRADVAAHPGQRYILYAHRPRYTSSSTHDPFVGICPLWDVLAATGGLEIVLGGHNHQYERFTPMDCAGGASAGGASAGGARSFVIGSGGAGLYDFAAAQPGSEFRNDSDFGVLRLELYENSYAWEFIASGVAHDGNGTVPSQNAGQILDKGSADV